MSSDDGGLLLREVDRRIGPTARLAACFVDYRHPASVEQDLSTLLAQRVHALALGYEDLNDHDALRRDVLLSLATEQADPTGAARVRARDRGAALASSSTLNRLELGDLERGDLAAAPSALHVDPRTSPGTSACDAPADPRPAHRLVEAAGADPSGGRKTGPCSR